MHSALSGMRRESGGPTLAIVGPSIRKRPGAIDSDGVNNLPALIAMSLPLLTTASQVSQQAAEISVGFRDALLGFVAAAPGSSHDDRHFQVRSGRVYQSGGFVWFNAENFLEHIS